MEQKIGIVKVYKHKYRYVGVTIGNYITEIKLMPWTDKEDFEGDDDGGVEYALPEGYALYTDPETKDMEIRTKSTNVKCYLLPYAYSKQPALVDPTKYNGFVMELKRVGD